MELNAEKISVSINKINIDSSEFALDQHKAGKSHGRLKPFTASFFGFISSFVKNINKNTFENRMINSCLMSFSEFVKHLKLLRLNKRF